VTGNAYAEPIWVHNDCMLGANGTQFTSKTVWNERGGGGRIDVENTNPGQIQPDRQ